MGFPSRGDWQSGLAALALTFRWSPEYLLDLTARDLDFWLDCHRLALEQQAP